jgi:hypothetical protein
LATLRGGNVPGPMIEAFAQQIMADVDKVKLTPPPLFALACHCCFLLFRASKSSN